MALDDIGNRIADEQNVDARSIEQRRHGRVVCRQRRYAYVLALHLLQHPCRYASNIVHERADSFSGSETRVRSPAMTIEAANVVANPRTMAAASASNDGVVS